MLAEDLEATSILVGQMLLHRVGDVCTLTTELQTTTHLLVDTDVELSDMDVLHDSLEQCDGRVETSLRGIIDVIVGLHTDTVDRNTLSLHLLHHVIDTVTLVRINGAIVVVEQQRLGVSLVSILESLLDELITAKTVHSALAIRIGSVRIVTHSLVHHVPAVHHILVTSNDSLDMVLHTSIELLLGCTLGSHPTTDLRVPHQCVTTQLDTVSTSEISDAVGILPVELTLTWFCGFRLHVVLSCNAVELLLDQSDLLGVSNIALINGNTNHEIVLIDVFQSFCRTLRPTTCCAHEKHHGASGSFQNVFFHT